ncbi:unnamed protein product [Thlaspi arvense]|uniref:At1g61320/AtMIF1 LRR domain-containing protein n=1 Tax=Thlaspi arvense TaxID=13288 RepID=A0AAU9RV57_THLAR|nr:unnamed protein product [Thlaspi arvense]
MSESSDEKIKLTEDLVEYIISMYHPIKKNIQNRVVSKFFNNAKIRSRDLDFSGIYSVNRSQSAVVRIIEDIFNQHKGSEINRFVLLLNHIGVEDKILSWINMCIDKKIQELILDFSRSKKVMEISIDFSAIETLTVLKLQWCKFEIPTNNTPKGLRLLRSLALMKTKVRQEIIDAIFSNCILLETFELIKCGINGVLRINAQNHKEFKSLVVCSLPKLLHIVVDAPTLEFFKYGGEAKKVYFLKVDALKEAQLYYNRNYNWRYYDLNNVVLVNMKAYTGVNVLTTTNIFLEALVERYEDGKMRKPIFLFWNLKEFHIHFKAPTLCTLYDIVEFLKYCPNLEKISIDINNFTFIPGMFWSLHHKPTIENQKYQLDSIREVEINGYKGHWHEIEILHFFLQNATCLKKLKLTKP